MTPINLINLEMNNLTEELAPHAGSILGINELEIERTCSSR